MDLYSLLQQLFSVKKRELSPLLFQDDKKALLETTDDEKNFDLLKNVSSIATRISNKGVEFCPRYVFDGKRTFSIEDLSDEDYSRLLSLDFMKMPVNLRAQVTGILWNQKKDYLCAQTAAAAYSELFDLWYSDEDWLEALNMIKRAICISSQINNQKLLTSCCEKLFKVLIDNDGNSKDFLPINIIEILFSQSYGDSISIMGILDKIIINSKDNPHKVEEAYLLKHKYLTKSKKEDSARQLMIALGDYFVDYAEGILKTDKQGPLRANYFFNKAIMIFRNNGEPKTAEITHRKLIEVQKEILKLMHTFSTPFDASKIIQNIDDNMSDLSFQESVIRLTQMVCFYKKDDIKKKVLNELNLSPSSHIFTSRCINSKGQTVFNLPPLDLSNPEGDEAVLELHIHKKMFEEEGMAGNLYLRFALSYIQNKFAIEKDDVNFLVDDNFVIPQGREDIMKSGIVMALQGKYYEALHILAPQVENVFRCIANEVGALTVTLDKDGISKEKLLSSIFDLPELQDCYDNDILFMFKGLLNEKAGANIRNNIAHGIWGLNSAVSGASLFFICAVIKLLAISSKKYMDIYNNQDKLHSFIALEKTCVLNENEIK